MMDVQRKSFQLTENQICSSILSADICTKFENLCSQICEATDDSYVCKCESGFKLAEDKITCIAQEDESSSARSNDVSINSTEYENFVGMHNFSFIFIVVDLEIEYFAFQRLPGWIQ